jgi:hypothetical protein
MIEPVPSPFWFLPHYQRLNRYAVPTMPGSYGTADSARQHAIATRPGRRGGIGKILLTVAAHTALTGLSR